MVSFATNSGGAAYTSSTTGISYLADSKYSGGSLGSASGSISGTNDGTLYKTQHYGNFFYSIPLANGNYSMTLKFC